MTIYAIGDIHGQLDALRAAHARIDADRAAHGTQAAQIVHLGDLTDRGPDSRGVLDHLIAGHAAGKPWITIKGNHDRMFHRFVTTGDQHDSNIKSGLGWLNPRLGGPATLASYGVADTHEADPESAFEAARAAVPQAHLEFIAQRPLYHRADDLLFVHAGIRPNLPLERQHEDDLIWIRDGFLDHTDPFDWLVIHGHTALDAPQHFGNRVDLDSGAGYGRPLTAAVIEGRDVFVLTDQGRVPLRP